jgi:hypothetical protein
MMEPTLRFDKNNVGGDNGYGLRSIALERDVRDPVTGLETEGVALNVEKKDVLQDIAYVDHVLITETGAVAKMRPVEETTPVGPDDLRNLLKQVGDILHIDLVAEMRDGEAPLRDVVSHLKAYT